MKDAELKEAIAKYIESKELVLMGYSPEYIDDVKTDMEIAFRAGAEWMAGQGEAIEKHIFKDNKGVGILMYLDEKFYNQGDKVVVQIRKK